MKGKMLIVGLCLSACAMGQGVGTKVPDSDEFYFHEIYDAVHAHAPGTTRDFSSCVANAIDAWFDTRYKGNKDMMASFRNYPVIPCERPAGLNTYNFYNTITIGGVTSNFTSSLSLARQACYDYNNNQGNAAGVVIVQCASLSVGEAVYIGTTTSCNAASDGYYLVFSGGENVTPLDKVIHVQVGLIVSITEGIQVGDQRGGGVVAYILQPGDNRYIATDINGLILSNVDVDTSLPFGCSGVDVSTSLLMGFGQSNTNQIIALPCGAGTAAWACDQYEVGNFSDWYCPSKAEMTVIMQAEIAAGLNNFLWDTYYWSSSQYTLTSAVRVMKTTDPLYDGVGSKTNLYRVKAVRSF